MIKKILLWSRKFFTAGKIMLARSQSYIAIANVGMVLFLFLAKFEDFGINIALEKWYVPIFVGSMIAMMIVGYLDDRLGFFSEEQRMKSDKNPYFVKIMREIREVNKKIDRLEEKK